jgi:hypothetical protein
VFVDESGANLAMGRSHAWVRKGQVVVEPRPMNWGNNLTMIGAMRGDRWLTLGTAWQTANADRFVRWVECRLAPKLRPGDIVLLDNRRAHKIPASAGSSSAVGLNDVDQIESAVQRSYVASKTSSCQST